MDMIIKLTLVEASKFEPLLAMLGIGPKIDELEGALNFAIESKATTEDEYAAELKALFESVDRLPEGEVQLRLYHQSASNPNDGFTNHMCRPFDSLEAFHGVQLAAIPALKTGFQGLREALQAIEDGEVGPDGVRLSVEPGPLMDEYRASQVQ